MKKLVYENGLTIVMLSFFAAFQIGLFFVGHQHYNNEQREHGQSAIGLGQYLASASSWEATSENWESEFLQMAAFVFLTAFLIQKGSAESKKPDESEAVDRDPRQARNKDAPWPVRQGGIALAIYEHSLTIALLVLFVISFTMHVVSGADEYNSQQIIHGEEPVTTLGYLATAQMWFESLQNWQSEFFSIAILGLLSIFLRQRGSPESKPVEFPHSTTGNN
jgi:hypothetical protein